jgi:hypothetical protein
LRKVRRGESVHWRIECQRSGSKIATLLPVQNPQLDEFMNALIWKAVPVII